VLKYRAGMKPSRDWLQKINRPGLYSAFSYFSPAGGKQNRKCERTAVGLHREGRCARLPVRRIFFRDSERMVAYSTVAYSSVTER
jgi:hypothetical protein